MDLERIHFQNVDGVGSLSDFVTFALNPYDWVAHQAATVASAAVVGDSYSTSDGAGSASLPAGSAQRPAPQTFGSALGSSLGKGFSDILFYGALMAAGYFLLFKGAMPVIEKKFGLAK
jgi:hypothetical protein